MEMELYRRMGERLDEGVELDQVAGAQVEVPSLYPKLFWKPGVSV